GSRLLIPPFHIRKPPNKSHADAMAALQDGLHDSDDATGRSLRRRLSRLIASLPPCWQNQALSALQSLAS
ncbi:MAG: hypothetical protein ABJA60_07340, partial [Nitrosospira sp.]